MGVVDGTPVDAATTNPAFIDANADDTGQGKYTLANPAAESGPTLVNIQREHNSIASWVGKLINIAKDALPSWTNNEGFTPNESVTARADALTGSFNKTTGHAHDGTDGGGAPVQSASIAGVVLHGYVRQAPLISGVTGSSTDVSTEMTGKFPSAGDTIKGVVVLAPNNRVIIRQGSGPNINDEFVDGSGNIVYARLTESAGVWTLSYFVDISGTETAYSFLSSVDVLLYYQELFNPIFDAPIYSEFAVVPSENTTEGVVDATTTQRGLISAGTQSLGGNKTWVGTQLFQAVVTFAANIIVQAKTFFTTINNSSTTGALATWPAPSGTSVRLTNVSLTSVQEISGGADGQFFLATNQTGNDLTVKNEAGTLGNRIRTGTGFDFTWKDGSAIVLYYEGASGFWYLTGGGGGGGVGYQEAPSNPVNGVNDTFGPLAITPLTDESVQVFVDGILRPKTEYTITANSVVFGPSFIPQTGQDVYFFYLASGVANPGPSFTGLLKTEFRTLTGGEITAKKVILVETPSSPGDVLVDMIEGTSQEFNVDYTVVGNELRWNGYALDGQLVAGDRLRVHYTY